MTTPKPEGPLGLLAELTYRCPLACAYCSNPIEIAAYRDELSTADWQRVVTEAADLGALQCHLSGGEPLLRRDLADIVATARDQGLYTNLVTSALGFTASRAAELHDAGLDHVQISLQADEPTLSDRIAGTPSFARKIAAARTVRELGWPLTLNVVLHRQNIDRVDQVLGRRRGPGRRPHRARQHPVLRLGVAQPDRAAAQPRAARGAPRSPCAPRRNASAARWRSSTWSPTTTRRTRSRAWAAGARASSSSCPPATRCRASLRTSCRCRARTSARRRCGGSGRTRRCSRRSAAPTGCRTRAAAAPGARSTSAAAAARRSPLTGDATRTDPVCHLSPDHGLIEAVVDEANDGSSRVDLPLVARPHA